MFHLTNRENLWTRIQYLLERLASVSEEGVFWEECLDALSDFLGASRTILAIRNTSQEWTPLIGRKRKQTLSPEDLADMHWMAANEALSTRRCVLMPGDDEQNTTLATPLRREIWQHTSTTPHYVGVLYVDFEDNDIPISPLHVEFTESVAILLGTTLKQRAKLETIEENLRIVQAQAKSDGPSLRQILASDSLNEQHDDINACVVGDSSVLVLGESGTGKTRIATAIAQASGRTPIVRATLGSSDDLNTITSELFGHERGAFSGAVTKRKGLVEHADGGTLILDEILNLPPHAQQLLLDFTQFGTYRPLGYHGQEPKTAHVRIIAATNGNIYQAIADTRFRQDLYFRLAGNILVLPPLRQRRQDIPQIAEKYLHSLNAAHEWKLTSAARRLLLSEQWEWEGNIRQLEGVMRRARDRALAADDPRHIIDVQHIGKPAGLRMKESAFLPVTSPSSPGTLLPPALNNTHAEPSSAGLVLAPIHADQSTIDRWTELQIQRASLESVERDIIDTSMIENHGVVSHAARELNLSRTSLLSRMKTLQIDKSKYK